MTMEPLSPIQTEDKEEVFFPLFQIQIYPDSSPGRWIVGLRSGRITRFEGTDDFLKIPALISEFLMYKGEAPNE